MHTRNILLLMFLCSILASCNSSGVKSYSVFLLQPIYDEAANYTTMNSEATPAIPVSGCDDASILENASAKLDELPNCKFDKHLKNKPITKEVLGSFKENQIIIFQGHADWLYQEQKIGIETGAIFDEGKYSSDLEYKNDCDNGLVLNNWNEIITPAFIEKYCATITNSIVYLGQCETCHEEIEYNDLDEVVSATIDESLVNAFLNKGAAAVIANTHTIGMRYGNLLEYETIKSLGEINSQTNKKYTIAEALAKAKNLYGEKDTNSGCVTTLFGNSNWRIE